MTTSKSDQKGTHTCQLLDCRAIKLLLQVLSSVSYNTTDSDIITVYQMTAAVFKCCEYKSFSCYFPMKLQRFLCCLQFHKAHKV